MHPQKILAMHMGRSDGPRPRQQFGWVGTSATVMSSNIIQQLSHTYDIFI